MELESLQIYWWLLISILGALLVFLLFVQGGQTFLLSVSDNSEASRRMIGSFGHNGNCRSPLSSFSAEHSSHPSPCSTQPASEVPTGCGCLSSSASFCRPSATNSVQRKAISTAHAPTTPFFSSTAVSAACCSAWRVDVLLRS